MREYHPNAMFEMLFATIVRNTVYQRLVFEQGQLGRPLKEDEVEKIWEDERSMIEENAANIDEVEKIYGDDAWK